MSGNSYEDALGRLKLLISDLCVKYQILAESPSINAVDKAAFQRLADKASDKVETCEALYLLTRMLSAHCKKPVILLIDEYDVPLAPPVPAAITTRCSIRSGPCSIRP